MADGISEGLVDPDNKRPPEAGTYSRGPRKEAAPGDRHSRGPNKERKQCCLSLVLYHDEAHLCKKVLCIPRETM